MSDGYDIETIPDPGSDWDRRIAGMQGVSIFHRAAWGSIWRELYGHRATGWIARRDGEDVAALLMVRKPSIVLGRHWISLPYFDAAAPVGDTGAAWPLIEEAHGLARRDRAAYLEIRTQDSHDWPMSCDSRKAHVVLDLPEPDAELLATLPKKVRSQVRRGIREGFERTVGGAELVPEFHTVYSTRMQGLGSPAHGPQLFLDILRHFPEEARVVILKHEGIAASAAVLLRDRDTVVIPWAATLESFNRLSANMVLYHACLEESVRWGARRFDFGRGDAGSSHMKFKLQWGGTEFPLYWYRLPEQPADAEGGGPGRAMLAASAIWKRLPLPVTRILGPWLVRQFS